MLRIEKILSTIDLQLLLSEMFKRKLNSAIILLRHLWLFSSKFDAGALIMNCVWPGSFNAPVSLVTSELKASSYLVLTVRFKMQHRHQPFSLTRLFTRGHRLNCRWGELQLPTMKQRQTTSGFATVGELWERWERLLLPNIGSLAPEHTG